MNSTSLEIVIVRIHYFYNIRSILINNVAKKLAMHSINCILITMQCEKQTFYKVINIYPG